MPSVLNESVLSTTIIIPQFNKPELTLQAVRSLRLADPTRWPILVVDNGSTSESLRQLHDIDDPDTAILSLPCQGLTAAWNQAARRCETDTLLFLNNDTISTGPWIAELLKPLAESRAWLSGAESRREMLHRPPMEMLAGWCFAVRRETFTAVGGFNESLSLYFSDTDFQLRVRDHFASSAIPPWVTVPGLPLNHLSHRTAHRLPNRQLLWSADRDRFQARWNRSQ